MIPGPYSVCRISFPQDSDAAIYTTIKYGYDSAEDAAEDIPELARAENIPTEDLVVIKWVGTKEEIDQQSD